MSMTKPVCSTNGSIYSYNAILARITATISGTTLMGPPEQHNMHDAFASCYLLHNLERKRETQTYAEPPRSRLQIDLRASIAESEAAVRSEKTLSGFLGRESENLAINELGINLDPDLITTACINHARGIIRSILGNTPNMKSILHKGSFGNGASATLRRAEADRTQKWVHKLSSTKATFELMRNYISTSPLWVDVLMNGDPILYIDPKGNTIVPDSKIDIRSSSVFDTVPKDTSIDRVILKEPELNGFLQKGIGSEIRTRFRRYGICLNTSGVKNSKLAEEGSIHGHLATIDAERASDSLTLALYKLLFPRKWYELLVAARTPYTLINSELHELQMMSGMGNGFTFEAESLIFYALGRAASYESTLPFAEEFVSVHGDDLIVPADVAFRVYELYAICGIVVNEAKSFKNGPFRESCGGHFYNGHSVKPFYVKGETGADIGDWFWLYNSLLLWLTERTDGFNRHAFMPILADIFSEASKFMKPADRKISLWKIPPTFSRRAGIFSNAPKLTNRSGWKICTVRTVPTQACTTMYGAYMQSLAKPMHITAYDIIMGRKPQNDNPWEVDTDSVEVIGYTRLSRWPSFTDAGLTTPLWLWTALKMATNR